MTGNGCHGTELPLRAAASQDILYSLAG